MSRIGRKPVELTSGVTARLAENAIFIKGPKGELKHPLHPRITVEIKGQQITFNRSTDRSPDRAAHGLMRSLVAGAVEGVTKGFEKTLEINGVGYRAQVEGRKVTLALGFSHPVVFEIPQGITVEPAGKNQLVIKGFDKHLVGHVASKIRSLKPPEPYKGKGIKYADEHIRRKVGKTGA
jgi:large subunit ribosomal protein L6